MRLIPHERMAEAVAAVERGTGVVLTGADLALLLAGHGDLADEVSAGLSSDTSVRERLADLVMTELTGRGWPTNHEASLMGPEGLAELMDRARDAAAARHWKLAGG